MKILTLGTRLVNRLVPTVDAHAICKPYSVFCGCFNNRRYIRICSYCEGSGGGPCSACLNTNAAC